MTIRAIPIRRYLTSTEAALLACFMARALAHHDETADNDIGVVAELFVLGNVTNRSCKSLKPWPDHADAILVALPIDHVYCQLVGVTDGEERSW